MLTETTVGSMNYNVLRNILKQGNVLQLQTGAEVGVLYGDTSHYLLSEFPGLNMYCIDPYIEYDEGAVDRSQNTLSQYETIARQRMSPFGSRANFLKLTSLEAAKIIPDGTLDFVFIDANHDYEHVREDIEAWWPKVRGQGLVAGHDISWSGVKQAVLECVEQRRVQCFHTPQSSDIWFFVKP